MNKLYKLEYGNDNGGKKFVGEFDTFKECIDYINKSLEGSKYQHGYIRYIHFRQDYICVDYGSWSYFYYITRTDGKEIEWKW